MSYYCPKCVSYHEQKGECGNMKTEQEVSEGLAKLLVDSYNRDKSGKDEIIFPIVRHDGSKYIVSVKPDDDSKREDQFKKVCEPVVKWLQKYGNPHALVTIELDGAQFYSGEIVQPFKVQD